MVLDASLNSGTLASISSKISLGNFNLQLWKLKAVASIEKSYSFSKIHPDFCLVVSQTPQCQCLTLLLHNLSVIIQVATFFPTQKWKWLSWTNVGAHVGADSSSLFDRGTTYHASYSLVDINIHSYSMRYARWLIAFSYLLHAHS